MFIKSKRSLVDSHERSLNDSNSHKLANKATNLKLLYENVDSSAVPTKLYVSNIPASCSRRQLTDYFSAFGQVLECSIMWDKYAFVHYGSMREAASALLRASRTLFMGKRLQIQLSTSRYRQTFDWYRQQQATKVQHLDEDCQSNNANTFVETKLHVSNLPENCDHRELRALFENYGNVLECVIMWNQYAFIHYPKLSQAKCALKALNGFVFNGKSLIVQLSISLNRPLPKCTSLNNNKNLNSNINLSKNASASNDLCLSPEHPEHNNNAKKLLTSILCYRAYESEKIIAKEPSKEINWIDIIKNGRLPVKQPPESDEKETQHGFSGDAPLHSMTPKNAKNIRLSELPTPERPDLSLKIPSSASAAKIVRSAEKSPSASNHLLEKNFVDDPKRLALHFEEIPTPPMSAPIVDEGENDCLKRLIKRINLTKVSSTDNNVIKQSEEAEPSNSRINELITPIASSSYTLSTLSSSSPSSSRKTSTSDSCMLSSDEFSDCLNSNYLYKTEQTLDQESSYLQIATTKHSETCFDDFSDNKIAKIKKTRCKVVNYILFPELREKYYSTRQDYESELVRLIKTNCTIENSI
jgi:RNA recognition motif-containing protein